MDTVPWLTFVSYSCIKLPQISNAVTANIQYIHSNKVIWKQFGLAVIQNDVTLFWDFTVHHYMCVLQWQSLKKKKNYMENALLSLSKNYKYKYRVQGLHSPTRGMWGLRLYWKRWQEVFSTCPNRWCFKPNTLKKRNFSKNKHLLECKLPWGTIRCLQPADEVKDSWEMPR